MPPRVRVPPRRVATVRAARATLAGLVRGAWLVVALHSAVAVAAERVFDVREHGAVGDGKTLATSALQKAIDRCAEAGGGTVLFPAGTYLSGGLVLKSNVTLQIEAGATLLGSPDGKEYLARPSSVPSYTDNYVRQALISGHDVENVAIRGQGTIDGNGGAFQWKEYLNRPYVIRLVKCRDVLVEGITLRASPMWMQHYLACDRLKIRGIRVFNHVSYNNDGIDIDACHDVFVSDCVIDSDDDALCLKSTTDRACENVTVTNCVLSSHANAFKLGTESNGGFKNITFTNSVILSPRFTDPKYGIKRGLGGIALETVDGGHVENIAISNITINGVNVPLFMRLGNRARPFTKDGPKPAVGSFRNVTVTNVVATRTGRIGCSITGLPGSLVENVSLSNLSFEFEGGGKKELITKEVPEKPEAYPESRMFGDLPAYGLYVRHAAGIRLNNVRFRTLADDARHAVVCDDVRELEIGGLNVTASAGAAPVVRFTNVVDALVRGSKARGGPEVFLRLDGGETRGISLVGNDFSAAQRMVDAGSGVAQGAWAATGNLPVGR